MPRPDPSQGGHQVTRILLVDDDPAARAAIASGLGGLLTFKALHDGEDFEKVVREFQPQIILLDINLPGRNGLVLLESIRPLLRDIPTLMLSVRGSDEDIIRAFEIGASDYITKPFSLAVLRARITRFLEKGAGSNLLKIGEVSIDLAKGRVTDGGRETPLTRKELLVLRCFLAHPGQILSRTQILDFAWGYDYEGTERTVDTVIADLRRKFRGASGTAEVFLSHRGLGYSLEMAASTKGPRS